MVLRTKSKQKELQKRLWQLEFENTYGKDLRALKQIFPMEKTHLLISKDDDNKTTSSTSFMQKTDHPIPSATSPSSKYFRSSSMVVMKAVVAPVLKETGISDSGFFSPKRDRQALPNVRVENLSQTHDEAECHECEPKGPGILQGPDGFNNEKQYCQ